MHRPSFCINYGTDLKSKENDWGAAAPPLGLKCKFFYHRFPKVKNHQRYDGVSSQFQNPSTRRLRGFTLLQRVS